MDKINKKTLQKAAELIKIQISEEELSKIEKEASSIEQTLNILNEINVDGVEPMLYPYEKKEEK